MGPASHPASLHGVQVGTVSSRPMDLNEWRRGKSSPPSLLTPSPRPTLGAGDGRTLRMRAGNDGMGEQFDAADPLESKYDVTAPERILQVDLIKDGQVIWSKQPNQNQLTGTFRDASVGKGNSYYYVRVFQYDPDPAKVTYPGQPDLKDPEMGWGSPMFVTYR